MKNEWSKGFAAGVLVAVLAFTALVFTFRGTTDRPNTELCIAGGHAEWAYLNGIEHCYHYSAQDESYVIEPLADVRARLGGE